MKSYNNLWDKFISKENFDLAYKNSVKGKSKQHQIIEFKKNKEENLEAVRQLVISGKFTTSEYKQSTIYEPKERIIYKLPYCPDRIVQHAIMNVLKPILTNLFISNTFACIEGRGQIKASNKCQEYVKKFKYCLKCDIKKFYPSVDHNILSTKLHRIIKDKKFMNILDNIIFSLPGGKNCPIGNYCSQWFGNYYLSFLDNFIHHKLKHSDYIRYSDDFMLFSNNKSILTHYKNRMREFLKNELKLNFSKSNIFNTKQGVDFCGYRHFGRYKLLRKSSTYRLKKRISKIKIKLDENTQFTLKELDHINSQLASANGWMKYANTHHLRIKLDLDRLKRIFNFKAMIKRETPKLWLNELKSRQEYFNKLTQECLEIQRKYQKKIMDKIRNEIRIQYYEIMYKFCKIA